MKLIDETGAWLDEWFTRWLAGSLTVVVVVATCAAVVTWTWKYLSGDASQLTELAKILVWPVVVALGLVAFRGAIRQFLAGIAQRVKKLSAFHLEVELVELTEKKSTALEAIK